jgi:branched-chain amino acid transport system ATP-binding protein
MKRTAGKTPAGGAVPRAGTTVLTIEGLTVSYGAVCALDFVNFEVRPGEIVTLIGSNGAGKSTTLNTIMGLVKTDRGKILLEGAPITNQHAYQIVRRGMSLSPEGRRIFLNLTVEENLKIGGLIISDRAKKKRLEDEVYLLFPRLKERHKQIAGTLSGGEQQMLAVARAMMQDPHVLLLDEPSLGLAPNLVQEIFQKIKYLNSEGKTILLVEQNAYQSLKISHRGYVLQNGKLVLGGQARDLLENPAVKQAYLGG